VIALDARIVVRPPAAQERAARFAIKPYPVELESETVDRDGKTLAIRPIRPDDEPLIQAFVRKLTPEDVRMRFFGPMREMTHELAARLTQIDYDRDMALVAVCDEGSGRERVIAAARYARDPDPRGAEFAVVVADEWQGRGLATRLMERLMHHAKSVGVTELSGSVLARNANMLELVEHLGFETSAVPGDGTVVMATRRL
jgi:acetyltransferase